MKKIIIKFVRLGSVQNIELPEGSLLSDLISKLSLKNKKGDFFRKEKKLNTQSKLKDNDVIIYARDIVGEATVRRNGKVWQVHKSDPDPFPSDFHAHYYDAGEVLDLYTGAIYKNKGRDKSAMLTEKKYKAILIDLSKREDFSRKAKDILKERFGIS